jgi:predicted esterase
MCRRNCFLFLITTGLTAVASTIASPASAQKEEVPKFAPGEEVQVEREGHRGHIIVYAPSDYTPERSWPIIFNFHGHTGKPTTWPFKQVTGGTGFIVVGMDYRSQEYHDNFDYALINDEIKNMLEISRMVRQQLKVDTQMIFIGGFSQGGYTTSVIAPKLAPQLAGFLVLGAGQGQSGAGKAVMRGKPIFVGAGENDDDHLPSAFKAAESYKRMGASVTFEEWKGIGHSVFAQCPKMAKFLKDNGPLRKANVLVQQAQAAEKAKRAGQAYTSYKQAAAISSTEEICQQAATAADKIAEQANAGFAEVQKLIDDGDKTKAYKQLLQLRRRYAGSEFGDKATETMKSLKSS